MHGLIGMDRTKEIELKDHSGEFQLEKESSSRKRPWSLALPNPHYLAIHAGIAGVLHMSGAGKFLDELLERFGGGDGSLPIHSWEELDRAVEVNYVEKSLRTLMVQ